MIGLYVAAVLTPLFAFAIEAIFIRQLKRYNAYIATGAIGFSCLLSLIGFLAYAIESRGFYKPDPHAAAEVEPGAEAAESAGAHAEDGTGHHKPLVWSRSFNWVLLGGGGSVADFRTGGTGKVSDLAVELGVSIDSLSCCAAVMFLMVTFVATLIHIYSMGYMKAT